MRTIKFILIATIIISSTNFCSAQGEKKITDKTVQTFLDKFRTITPPINYKKTGTWGQDMSEEEAIKFLHKTEADIYCVLEELGEDDNWYKTVEKNIPGCKFKYSLNDSIYVLCVVEAILGVNSNTILATLYSFTHNGEAIDKCLVREEDLNDDNFMSFVLLNKTHIRVFYYASNYERKAEGFLSAVYYVNYEITEDGKFIEKDKSEMTYLKKHVNYYSTYKPKSDDPMNEYDF
jgi:hypothetical protein